MYQNHFNAHALNHGQVLGEMGQFSRRDGFTRNANDKSLVAKLVNVGCDRTKPRNKGKVKYGGHGKVWDVKVWRCLSVLQKKVRGGLVWVHWDNENPLFWYCACPSFPLPRL